MRNILLICIATLTLCGPVFGAQRIDEFQENSHARSSSIAGPVSSKSPPSVRVTRAIPISTQFELPHALPKNGQKVLLRTQQGVFFADQFLPEGSIISARCFVS